MGRGKKWTPEEELYLEQKWGQTSVKNIAKKLNRSMDAVIIRAKRLGLGSSKTAQGYFTANQLAQACNIDFHSVKRWIKKGLPAKTKITRLKQKFYLISPEDFWQWAAEHKEIINFAKIQRGIILPEPEWLDMEVRRAIRDIPKRHQQKWTKEEDARLLSLVRTGKTYEEIASLLNRTKNGVTHRLSRLANKNKAKLKKILLPWTEKEEQIFLEMERQGCSDKEIADALGREVEHIRDHRRNLRNKGIYEGMKFEKDYYVHWKTKECMMKGGF